MVTTPANPNLLNDKGAKMVLTRFPDLVFYVQRIRIPEVRVGATQQWAPMDQMPWPGDTLYRDDFAVQFKVNEDMTNYMQMYDWMVKSVAPNSPAQYRELIGSGKNQRVTNLFSDVTISVPNSSYTVNKEFRLEDAFPFSLTSLDFTTQGNDTQFIDCTVTFRFRHFTVHKISL